MIAIWGSVNISVSISYEESESFTSSSEFVGELETCSRSLNELKLCSGRTVCWTWNYPSHFKIGISWYTATVDLHMDNLNAFLESLFNDLSAAKPSVAIFTLTASPIQNKPLWTRCKISVTELDCAFFVDGATLVSCSWAPSFNNG